MTSDRRPLPDIHNALTAPFWQAAHEHRLVMQRCAVCDHLRWPPRVLCPACLAPGTRADWTQVGDTGAVWSFAVYHRAFHPGFVAEVPYNVAYVKLDAGPMFISNVIETNDLAIGCRVAAYYDDVTPEVTLVKFRLIPAVPAVPLHIAETT